MRANQFRRRWLRAGVLAVAAMATFAAPASAQTDWELNNQTSVPLWGEVHSQCGKDNVSNVAFDASHALQPYKTITVSGACATLANLYQWGRFCYDGHWWNLKRDVAYNSVTIYLRERTVDQKPILFAQLVNGALVDLAKTDGC
jgi:hypothetical protein